jgi:phasin family protein
MAARKKTGKSRKSSKRRALSSASATQRRAPAIAATAGPAIWTQAMDQFLPNQSMEKTMTKSKSQMDRLAQDAGHMGKEGFEAFIKSSTVFAKGFEEILRAGVALAQDSAERQAQYMKEALSSKTLNEWTEVQNKIAQASFDDFMAGTTKITEMGVKVLTETAEPFNAQMGKAIKKASDSMAA